MEILVLIMSFVDFCLAIFIVYRLLQKIQAEETLKKQNKLLTLLNDSLMSQYKDLDNRIKKLEK